MTLDDIALANRLALELLGRSLDELPPQTRRLLETIKGLRPARARSSTWSSGTPFLAAAISSGAAGA